MRNPDEAIDKALQAFRRDTPPAGMESRILWTLAALDRRSAQGSSASGSFHLAILRFLRPLHRNGFATGGAAACVLTVSLLFWAWAPSSHHAPTASLNRVIAPNSAYRPALAPEAGPKPLDEVRATRPHQPSASRRTKQGNSLDAQLTTEAVIDHPAPPLPLTQQERLLLQLARRENAQVQALLDPAQQDHLLAQNDKEFDSFFIPPPPPQEPEQPAAPGGNQ